MRKTSRREFLRSIGLAAGAVALQQCQTACSADRSDALPNIIVCMVDDMGFSDPGCFGGEIKTPNLDRLASNGVRLVNFHNTSRCCPSRASILTGLYPHQTGMGYMTKDSGHPSYAGGLKRPCVTIAEVLSRAGYATCLSGKWHLSPGPREMGFQTTDTWFAAGATGFFFKPNKNGHVSGKTDSKFYVTDYYADGVVDFIGAQAGKKPFFVYWTPTAPHYPIHAKNADAEKYRKLYASLSPEAIAKGRHRRLVAAGLFDRDHPWDVPDIVKTKPKDWFVEYRLDTDPPGQAEAFRKRSWKSGRYDSYGNTSDLAEIMSMYAAMIDRFDQGLGRVLAKLKATGQLDNTLILFCSDNGCSGEGLNIGPQLSNASTTPFLKTKASAYNGGVGTPLIVHWPGATDRRVAGGVNRTFGHLVDIMPTVLAAAKASYPKTDRKGRPVPPMEGRSILAVLQGKTVALDRPIGIEHRGNVAVITEKWKITADGREMWRLYDLTKDRFERRDLASEHPEVVKRLAGQWQKWADRVGALRNGQPKRK